MFVEKKKGNDKTKKRCSFGEMTKYLEEVTVPIFMGIFGRGTSYVVAEKIRPSLTLVF